jgi:hypothetical protein
MKARVFAVAQYDGEEASLKQSLGRTLVASIGTVCSVALRKLAVRVEIEAKPPKLGPFMRQSMRRCLTGVHWASHNAWSFGENSS